ncbi:MAG TPA: hypothetical protein VK805_17750 [Candidatus Baltobacteraceae bacterium]|jgi:hypothetical protein|nr:hypothetical protein [Candidatus Baltobacteraceae bacterium]
MIGFEQAGRWIFLIMALIMGLLVGQFLVGRLKKGTTLGSGLFMALGTALYFAAAVGVFLWKPWGYFLGICIVALTLLVSVVPVIKKSPIGAAVFYTGLWVVCLVWFLLPSVRHKFGP